VIPMGHLAASLEAIGSIQLFKNNYEEVATTLERLCPLLELLPGAGRVTRNISSSSSSLASCFQTLKDIYRKLLQEQQQFNVPHHGSASSFASKALSGESARIKSKEDTLMDSYGRSHVKMKEKVKIMEDYLQSRADIEGKQKGEKTCSSKDGISPIPLSNQKGPHSDAQHEKGDESGAFFEEWVKSVNKNSNIRGLSSDARHRELLANVSSEKLGGKLDKVIKNLREIYSSHESQLSELVSAEWKEEIMDEITSSLGLDSSVDNNVLFLGDGDGNDEFGFIRSSFVDIVEEITEIDLLSSFYPSTGIIEDLEVLLMSFVSSSSEEIQNLVLKKLELYCEDFARALRLAPLKTQSIFAEDYELAKAYYSVLQQILMQGYGFVQEELLKSGISVEIVEEYNELMRVRESVVQALHNHRSVNVEQLRDAYGIYFNSGIFHSPTDLNGLYRCIVLTTVSQALIKNIINYNAGVEMPRDAEGILSGLALYSPSYWLQQQQQQLQVLDEQLKSSSGDALDLHALGLSSKKASGKVNKLRSFIVDGGGDVANTLSYGGGIEDLTSVRASMPAIQWTNAIMGWVILFFGGVLVVALSVYRRQRSRSQRYHPQLQAIKRSTPPYLGVGTSIYSGVVGCVDWLDANIFHLRFFNRNGVKAVCLVDKEVCRSSKDIRSSTMDPGPIIESPRDVVPKWLVNFRSVFRAAVQMLSYTNIVEVKPTGRFENIVEASAVQEVPVSAAAVAANEHVSNPAIGGAGLSTLSGLVPILMVDEQVKGTPKAVKFSLDSAASAHQGSSLPEQKVKKAKQSKGVPPSVSSSSSSSAVSTSVAVPKPSAVATVSEVVLPASNLSQSVKHVPKSVPVQPQSQPPATVIAQSAPLQPKQPAKILPQQLKTTQPAVQPQVQKGLRQPVDSTNMAAGKTTLKPTLEVFKSTKLSAVKADAKFEVDKAIKNNHTAVADPFKLVDAQSTPNKESQGKGKVSNTARGSVDENRHIMKPEMLGSVAPAVNVHERMTSADMDDTLTGVASNVDWLVDEPLYSITSDSSLQFSTPYQVGDNMFPVREFNDAAAVVGVTPPPGLGLDRDPVISTLTSFLDENETVPLLFPPASNSAPLPVEESESNSYLKSFSNDDLDLSGLLGNLADDTLALPTTNNFGLGFSFGPGYFTNFGDSTAQSYLQSSSLLNVTNTLLNAGMQHKDPELFPGRSKEHEAASVGGFLRSGVSSASNGLSSAPNSSSFGADQYFPLSADAPEFSPSVDYAKFTSFPKSGGLPASASATVNSNVFPASVNSSVVPASGSSKPLSVAYTAPSRSRLAAVAAATTSPVPTPKQVTPIASPQAASLALPSLKSLQSPPASSIPSVPLFSTSLFGNTADSLSGPFALPPLNAVKSPLGIDNVDSSDSISFPTIVPPMITLAVNITVCCTIIPHAQTSSVQV
jgi:hypothetical protein